MSILKIYKDNSISEFEFTGEKLLSDALREAGFFVQHPCGGRGVCGKCAADVKGNVSEPSPEERKTGCRLSCKTMLLGDAEVRLKGSAAMQQIEIDGIRGPAPLNGESRAGTAENSADGSLESGKGNNGHPTAADILCRPKKNGMGDAPAQREKRTVPPFSGPEENSAIPFPCGAAVDIGTTTLALKLFDLRTGEELSSAAAINPQTSVAADVMGRIGAAMNGSAELLRRQICDEIASLLEEACRSAGLYDSDNASGTEETAAALGTETKEPSTCLAAAPGTETKESSPCLANIPCLPPCLRYLIITGNTTMLYLLTGKNPERLSHAPFEADCLFGFEDEFMGIPCLLPGCMNAFVGADITCAVLSSGMTASSETSLLCDIGTNGELALWKDGRLYVTSTAAGPAFEGAGISCGCGSIEGAIDRVWTENGEIRVHTIGDAPAVGLCGSGLIDAIAAFLSTEAIDETGAADDDFLPLSGDVGLVPKDIRAVQLAKAAIAAGIQTLIITAGVSPEEVKTLYIAGGFGSHLNVESAAAIGLIPFELKEKVRVIGNAALSGAAELLLDRKKAVESEAIVKASSHVNLGGSALFNNNYMEQMLFPEV